MLFDARFVLYWGVGCCYCLRLDFLVVFTCGLLMFELWF